MPIQPEEDAPEPKRCAIVVDQDLPAGRAANAAAVIALTLGMRHPHLVGAELVDASGFRHPGLIPIGVAVLAAPIADLKAARDKALERNMDVVDFPRQGQETNDYTDFRARVAEVAPEDLAYVGVGLYGTRKGVGRLVGRFPLLG